MGALVMPAVFAIAPQKTFAALFGLGGAGGNAVIVIDGPGTIPERISAAANTTSAALDSADQFMKNVLNPLAWAIAKMVIQQMTADIVNWINNGFEGNPGFITDPEQFFADVLDQVSGAFIEKLGLTNLCSYSLEPFRFLLRKPVPQRYRFQCTLSGVVRNFRDLELYVHRVGWEAWINVTLQPENNIYGQYLLAVDERERQLRNAEKRAEQEANWASGFIAFRHCTKDTVMEEATGQTAEVENCSIKSPGVLIEDVLANQFGSTVRQLELADSFNEIVQALIVQLTQQIFGGVGLLGLSDRSGGQPSYTDRLGTDINAETLPGVRRELLDELARRSAAEGDYRAAKEAALRSVLGAETKVNELIACYTDKLTRTQTVPLTLDDAQTARSRIAAASTTLATDIAPRKDTLQSAIVSSNELSAALAAFRIRAESAQTVSTMSAIAEDYRGLLETEALHSEADVISARVSASDTDDAMTELRGATQQKIEECRVFPLTLGGGTPND